MSAKSYYNVSAEKLLELGAHYGHKTKRWNPKSGPYVHGVREGSHIFDLIKTKEMLEDALKAIEKTAAADKVILLVGTKKQAKDKVREVAQKAQIPYIDKRWLGGTLTNFDQIRGSIDKMIEIKKGLEEDEYDDFTKKERLSLQRKVEKLEGAVGGIKDLSGEPDMIVFIDTHRERQAVAEALLVGVTTVGIVDSNADPGKVTYPIPMNDDAQGALEYVLDLIGEAIMKGKKVEGQESKSKTKE